MNRMTVLLAAAALAVVASASVRGQTDLTGTISAENGEPLPGARVWIYTAGPKVGVGFL